ncbi:hypothetical protein IMSAG044_01727 [Lactobacillaceae bacterium]|nr:hypothetical protein IMSAG044_01727 [Lactobacillaceae bacterium]
MADKRFKVLINALKLGMSEEESCPIERAVETVIGKYLSNQYDLSYSTQNYKRLYYVGMNSRAAKRISDAGVEEDSFRRWINGFSDNSREHIAIFLTEGLGLDEGLDSDSVSYFCTNLFSEIISDVTSGKNKENKNSSSKNEKQKFDVRTGAHQFIEYEVDKNVIDVDGDTYSVSPHLQGNVSEKTESLPYSKALFEAYSEKSQIKIDADNVDASNYAKHYRRQQRFFNEAAWYEHSLRDNVIDFDNQYELLKQDVYDGIEPVYSDEGFRNDGIKRLKEVHKQVVLIQLDRSNLKNIDNMLGNNTKKGLCHMLVNDNRIKSWVNVDYDEII